MDEGVVRRVGLEFVDCRGRDSCGVRSLESVELVRAVVRSRHVWGAVDSPREVIDFKLLFRDIASSLQTIVMHHVEYGDHIFSSFVVDGIGIDGWVPLVEIDAVSVRAKGRASG